MRYAITGGAGFIGSHLVDALVERSGASQIRILDNLRRGRRDYLSRHAGNRGVCFEEGDIRDEAAVEALVRGADVVFHLAAQSNVIGAGQDVGYSAGTNVMGTVNVLKASAAAGVQRLVFTSSREAYGEATCLPVPEGAHLAPKNLYGASKVAGEMYCRAFLQAGLDVRIVRLANVYGPRDRDRVIPIWLEKARTGGDIEVFGGRQVIDFVPVRLVVEALIRASEAEALSGPVNIGGGRGTPILELAMRILELTGSGSRVAMRPAREEEVVGFVADVSAMKTQLGLEPPADPLEGLAELIEPAGAQF